MRLDIIDDFALNILKHYICVIHSTVVSCN